MLFPFNPFHPFVSAFNNAVQLLHPSPLPETATAARAGSDIFVNTDGTD
jgi:hypothetical protein